MPGFTDVTDFTDLQDRRVVVVGLGRSGVAAARLLNQRGARVIGTDTQGGDKLNLAQLIGLPIDHRGAWRHAIRLELEGIRPESLRGAELIVLSPGVPPTLPAIAAAREAGVPITGELELAARLIEAPIVGITGTNGKSTVTSLCGAIAAATGRPSFCGGNLGTPLSDVVGRDAAGPGGIVVCEMSSFQLETADHLRCAAAAVLNLTPDHLDRYPSLQDYGDAKGRILRGQGSFGTRVFNADDGEVLALARRALGTGGPAYLFSLLGRPPSQRFMERDLLLGGWVDGGDLVLSGVAGGLRGQFDGAPQQERYPVSELQIIGRHNLANALAAFLLMRASGLATYEQVRRAAAAFRPLPHRMELVVERGGVRFYDDSKGTNVDAVAAGLRGFPLPLCLIAGGRDKGGSYAPLREALSRATVRGVVLIGEAAPLIDKELRAAGPPAYPVLRQTSLQGAVALAASLCRGGDAVVLSPACSSYDMFRDYAHRAAVFRQAAEVLL